MSKKNYYIVDGHYFDLTICVSKSMLHRYLPSDMTFIDVAGVK